MVSPQAILHKAISPSSKEVWGDIVQSDFALSNVARGILYKAISQGDIAPSNIAQGHILPYTILPQAAFWVIHDIILRNIAWGDHRLKQCSLWRYWSRRFCLEQLFRFRWDRFWLERSWDDVTMRMHKDRSMHIARVPCDIMICAVSAVLFGKKWRTGALDCCRFAEHWHLLPKPITRHSWTTWCHDQKWCQGEKWTPAGMPEMGDCCVEWQLWEQILAEVLWCICLQDCVSFFVLNLL